MQTTWLSLLVLAFSCGCASSDPVVTSDGAGSQRQLQKVKSEHVELLARLGSAPKDQLAACQMSAGDCTLQVSESRGKLVSEFRIDSCEQEPDAQTKTDCVIKQLDDGAHARELADYLALENWCLGKLTACTAARAQAEQLASLDKRAATRKQELEALPAATTARNGVELARAQIAYLRSTLPPNGSTTCEPRSDVEACRGRATAAQQALDEQLRLDDYSADAALVGYQAMKQAETSCDTPELECLSSALTAYGVFPESRKWVDRNLALLAQRQELASHLQEQVSTECVAGPQLAHQTEIVSAYVPYAKEPVLYFRTQLDKAFIALHQAQISCLSSRRKSHS